MCKVCTLRTLIESGMRSDLRSQAVELLDSIERGIHCGFSNLRRLEAVGKITKAEREEITNKMDAAFSAQELNAEEEAQADAMFATLLSLALGIGPKTREIPGTPRVRLVTPSELLKELLAQTAPKPEPPKGNRDK